MQEGEAGEGSERVRATRYAQMFFWLVRKSFWTCFSRSVLSDALAVVDELIEIKFLNIGSIRTELEQAESFLCVYI